MLNPDNWSGKMYMKYVRFKYAGFVLVEAHRKHSDLAKLFPNDEVISAGQVNVTCNVDQISCYGESTSIKISSKTKDSADLYRRLGIYD